MANEGPDLSKMAKPVMRATMPDGTTREWDIFAVAAKIAKIAQVVESGQPASADDYDVLRKAFGLPTAEEAKEKGQEELHSFYCLVLMNALMERFDEVSEVKKVLARSQK